MSKVLKEHEFENEVINTKGLVLVDFFTEWCGYCQLLVKELELTEQELPNVKIVKVDAEATPNVAEYYNVTFYPEMLIFKDGQLVDHIDGYVKSNIIINKLKGYL